MPATDYQSLLSGKNLPCYNNLGMQDQQLIKLALLQIIANALNPMAATDQASLLSSANVACYRSVGSYPLLELALLQIIANGIGAAGGGGTQTGSALNPNTAGVVPAGGTNSGGWYYQDPALGTGSDIWEWSVSTQTWVQYSV